MKKFIVSNVRWASEDELKLPFWIDWNKKNSLPNGFWQRIWEYPYLSSRIPSLSKSLDVGGTYPFVLFSNFPKAISVDNRDLNKLNHPLHKNKWPKDKLIISDATNIPLTDNSFDYCFSISTIEEISQPIKALKEMIRLAKHRVVVTIDVSDKLGLAPKKLREIEKILNYSIPNLPLNSLTSVSPIIKEFGQSTLNQYKDIRVLAITIDSIDKPKSVAILIPHWESWQFLKPCLESIQKNRNEFLEEKIYVLDDASKDGSFEKARNYFKDDKNIQFHRFERPNKKIEADVGLLLDYGLKTINEQLVVMLDSDTIALNKDWVSFPIWLIEKFGCSSVGLDTGLSTSYLPFLKSEKIWQPKGGYEVRGGLYDNQWFSCTNNLYRVMRTATAKVVSDSIGFTRASPKETKKIIRKIINKIDTFLKPNNFLSNVYQRIIKQKFLNVSLNDRHPYLPEGCDNGVAANHFIDINYLGPKFNIPLTSYINLTPKDGAFGQNISGLLFHFALSTRALSKERREVNNPGDSFLSWANKLNNLNDQVLKEMIEASKKFQPGGYDNSIPISWYEEEYKYIQSLLKQYNETKNHRLNVCL